MSLGTFSKSEILLISESSTEVGSLGFHPPGKAADLFLLLERVLLLDLVSAVGPLPLGPAALISKLTGSSSFPKIGADSAVGVGSAFSTALPGS